MRGRPMEGPGLRRRSLTRGAAGAVREGESVRDQEVPEPDSVEQARPVGDPPAVVRPSVDPEAPEADAVEQAQPAPYDDDEAFR